MVNTAKIDITNFPKTRTEVPKHISKPPVMHDVFKYNASQGKLLLVSLPDKSVLGHVVWTKGGYDEATQEAAARAHMQKMRDSWWTNARHYCGDRLEIQEVQDPARASKKIAPGTKITGPAAGPLDGGTVV